MNAQITRLPILVLEPHGRCNCRCLMCDIWKSTGAAEITGVELERHLEDIARLGVEWIVFTGGEPLMHSDFFRLCRLLRGSSVRLTLLSSGLLLTRYAREIIEHVNDVIVSLDGPREVHDQIRGVPRAFDMVAVGVEVIHRLLPEFSITARCTVQAANAAHLRATVASARQLGLGSISFLAADLTSSAFNRATPWPSDRQNSLLPDLPTLEGEMQALMEAYPCDGFILESPAKLRRIVSHFRAYARLDPQIAPRCNAPWISAVIENTLDVRPCFFQPAIGNLAGRSLLEVLNSPSAIRFRNELNVENNPICRRCVCSLYRTAS